MSDLKEADFVTLPDGDIVSGFFPWGNVNDGDCVEECEIYLAEIADAVLRQIPETIYSVVI